MKIQSSNNSWVKYSQTFVELVNSKKPSLSRHQPVSYRKLRPLNKFLAWPKCPKRHLSYLAGYTLSPLLEIKFIEDFLKRDASLGRAEPLLRTSPLLGLSDEDWHGAALEKAVAIKRMAELIHETLSTMKSLTLVQSTNFRG